MTSHRWNLCQCCVPSLVKIVKSFERVNYKAIKIERYCVKAHKQILLALYATGDVEEDELCGRVGEEDVGG